MSGSIFSLKNDLASFQNGGRIIFATDDFFAVAENLIKDDEPEWREKEYTPFGKWMDGWETRRKRKAGHDFCIIELAAEAFVEVIDVNTAFFTGNHPPAISVQASSTVPAQWSENRRSVLGSEASTDLLALADSSKEWTTILETVPLKPGYPDTRHNIFEIPRKPTARYLRLNLYPDGGVARFRVFGKPKTVIGNVETDVAGFLNGGECISCSNAHFGQPKNLLKPGKSTGMFDGWETARRIDRPQILKTLPDGSINHSGSEWVIIKLGCSSIISELIVETHHFKGNYPDSVQVEGSNNIAVWETILPFSPLTGDSKHVFQVTKKDTTYQFIKVIIKPDGGISRVRVIGIPTSN